MTRLGMMLNAFEQKNDLSGLKMAEEIGVDKSTFCRIKQGKMPDAKNMAKIITWMIEPPTQ